MRFAINYFQRRLKIYLSLFHLFSATITIERLYESTILYPQHTNDGAKEALGTSDKKLKSAFPGDQLSSIDRRGVGGEITKAE